MNSAQKGKKFIKALVTRTLEFEFERMQYKLENVPLSKLLAMAHAEINCKRAKPAKPWYPAQLQIEISASCTLSCPLCPAGIHAIDKPGRQMSFDTFKSLIDETGDHAVIAVMWMWGEPFINNNLPEMVAYAKSKNMGTVTSTNGQHMQTLEEAERLVASGLDNLIIAMDGATQEAYSHYRIGGKLDKLINCMDLVNKAKHNLGSLKPFVNVRTVVAKHNEHELADIESIAGRYGADMVSRKTMCIPDYCGSDKDEAFAPDDPRYRRFNYTEGRRVRHSINEYKCSHPWNRMSVNSGGEVLACEFDFNASMSFGKGGTDSSFMEAWRGPKAERFRQQFLKDRTVYKFCAECHFRDRVKDENTVELQRLAEKVL